METGSGIRCPRCGSEAIYRFGNTASGKRRFICQVCSRQFITDYSSNKLDLAERPTCRLCAAAMHVYMRDAQIIRFRCSRYPECRGFASLDRQKPDAPAAARVTPSGKVRIQAKRKEIPLS
jgi:ssDNA-binding Zn-finger/Zn-ribbon topoisomerase 1